MRIRAAKSLLKRLNFTSEKGSNIWKNQIIKEISIRFGRKSGETIISIHPKRCFNANHVKGVWCLKQMNPDLIMNELKKISELKQMVREVQLSYLLNDLHELRK